MAKELTKEDQQLAGEMLARARAAMAIIEDWSQKDLDRLSQAIAWYAGNEKTFTRLAQQGVIDRKRVVDEPGRRRFQIKVKMVLLPVQIPALPAALA